MNRHADSTNVLFELWLASRAATSVLDEALAPSGLTADEFAVYSVLSAGPLTPSEVAEWVSAPLTTVSSYVKRFERRGHVRRVPNPDDGRSYRVQLTRAGVRAHERAGSAFLPVLDEVRRALGRTEGPVRAALASLQGTLRQIPVDVSG